MLHSFDPKAMIYQSLACSLNLSGDPGRGEVKGFDEAFVDTLFLRCEAT